MSDRRDEYTAKMQQQMHALSAEIDAQGAKGRAYKQGARQQYQVHLTELRQRATLAVERLHELELAGEHSWNSALAGMETVRDAFAHAVREFKAQLS